MKILSRTSKVNHTGENLIKLTKNLPFFLFQFSFSSCLMFLFFYGNVFIHYLTHQNCRLLIEVDYVCWSGKLCSSQGHMGWWQKGSFREKVQGQEREMKLEFEGRALISLLMKIIEKKIWGNLISWAYGLEDFLQVFFLFSWV